MEYHKHAFEILSELAPVVDSLQEEQEVNRMSVPGIRITDTSLQ